MRITVHLRQTDRARVLAYCPDLPGCSASGETDAEAIELLKRRMTALFNARRRGDGATRTTVVDV